MGVFPTATSACVLWAFLLHDMKHKILQAAGLKFLPKAKAFQHPANGNIKVDVHIPSLIEFVREHVKDDCDWINLGIKQLREPGPDGRTHCVFLWDGRYKIPSQQQTQAE